MRTLDAVFLMSCCAVGQDKAAVSAAEGACGPQDVKFVVNADNSQHPTPVPESGKALLYVVQEEKITSRLGVDGKWVGADKGRTYFVVPIEPGDHHLCAMGRLGAAHWVSLRQLKAEPGATYYLVPHIVGEAVYSIDSKFTLSIADPDEGKYLVARAKFSTSHPKK